MFSWNSCEQWGKKTNKGDEKMKEKEKGRQERREGRKAARREEKEGKPAQTTLLVQHTSQEESTCWIALPQLLPPYFPCWLSSTALVMWLPYAYLLCPFLHCFLIWSSCLIRSTRLNFCPSSVLLLPPFLLFLDFTSNFSLSLLDQFNGGRRETRLHWVPITCPGLWNWHSCTIGLWCGCL